MSSTKIVKIDPLTPQEEYIKEAAGVIAKGGLVIIPTETVYGIAANMLNNEAVNKLYEIKGRPKEKRFSLHIYKKESIEEFAQGISIRAYKLMDKFWPGPLTVILQAKTGGTIAMRMPDNNIALKVIELSGVPVVCPSANISGNPAPVDFSVALKDFEGQVNFAIDSGPTKMKMESLVVDLTVEPASILREGAIKKQDIEDVIKKKTLLFVCTGNSCRSVMAQGLLRKRLKEKGRTDIEVLSAGIMMLGGMGASAYTIELLAQEGIDVSSHISQRITKEMLHKSDIILVMEKLQEARILELVPQVKNRLFLLKEFAKIEGNNLDIEDPIGKDRNFYAQTLYTIKEAIEKIVKDVL